MFFGCGHYFYSFLEAWKSLIVDISILQAILCAFPNVRPCRSAHEAECTCDRRLTEAHEGLRDLTAGFPNWYTTRVPLSPSANLWGAFFRRLPPAQFGGEAAYACIMVRSHVVITCWQVRRLQSIATFGGVRVPPSVGWSG